MINFFKKTSYILLLIFTLLFPLLPSYGKFNVDILVYLLILIEFLKIILSSEERELFTQNIKIIFLKNKIFLSLILLNLTMYLSIFVAANKHLTLSNSIRFSMYLFILYYISYKLNKNHITNLIISFLLSSIIVSLITIFQVVYTKFIGSNIDMNHRIASTLENPNNLGVYSVILIFIFISLVLNSKNNKLKILSIVSTALLFFNIVVSQSRNALLALIIGIFIFAILYNKRFLLYSFFLPVILFIIPQARNRLLAILDVTQNDSRLKIWKLTEIMINNHNELLGLGYENYSLYYPSYLESNPSYFVRESLLPLHPHNALLKFQVELGILGSIFFLAFVLISVFIFYKLIKSIKLNNNSLIYLGMFVSFICFQTMNIIDCYYGPIKIMYSLIIVLSLLNNKWLIEQNLINKGCR